MARTLASANSAGTPLNLAQDNRQIKIQVGEFLSSVEQVQDLVVAVQNQRPVYLSDT